MAGWDFSKLGRQYGGTDRSGYATKIGKIIIDILRKTTANACVLFTKGFFVAVGAACALYLFTRIVGPII